MEFRKNGVVDLLPEAEQRERERVLTWAGLDTGRPEGELGVGVVHHLVGFKVVERRWRTGVLTGAVVVKVPAGLDRKQRGYGLLPSSRDVLLDETCCRSTVWPLCQVGLKTVIGGREARPKHQL